MACAEDDDWVHLDKEEGITVADQTMLMSNCMANNDANESLQWTAETESATDQVDTGLNTNFDPPNTQSNAFLRLFAKLNLR